MKKMRRKSYLFYKLSRRFYLLNVNFINYLRLMNKKNEYSFRIMKRT